MKRRPQDIYDKNRDEGQEQDVESTEVDYWTSARRKQRLMNLLWALLVGCVIGGLVYVMIEYNDRSKRTVENVYFGSRYSPDERIISFRTVSSEEDMYSGMEVAIDELRVIKTLELPEQGSAPLTPQWLKQAAHYLLAAEQAEASGQYDKALEMYNKVLVIFPAIENVHALKGMIYMKMERHSDALEAFKLALKEKGVTAAVVNNLGSCYLALNQLSQAEKCFQRALKMDSELPSARLNLATVYMKTSRAAEAAGAFDLYIQKNPNDLKAMQAYGTLLLENKEWRKAAQIFMEVQQKAPEIGPVYFRLGEALSHFDDKAPAVEILRKGVLLVDPRTALGWLASDRYDALRATPDFQKLIRELSKTR